jgi:hypothetical protein
MKQTLVSGVAIGVAAAMLFATNALGAPYPNRSLGGSLVDYGVASEPVTPILTTYGPAANGRRHGMHGHRLGVATEWWGPQGQGAAAGGRWLSYPGWQWNGGPRWYWDGYPRWLWHG